MKVYICAFVKWSVNIPEHLRSLILAEGNSEVARLSILLNTIGEESVMVYKYVLNDVAWAINGLGDWRRERSM